MYIPANSVHDWRRLLAQPHHWKAGYSAMAIARCWQEADGFPASIADLFDNSGIADLASPELLLALPEHKVPLPPARGRPSQSDVFALARSGTRLVAIAVEGKAEEGFGPSVDEWLASSRTRGKVERLTFLCDLLALDEGTAVDLPYQLLHRTASALIEAERFAARHAVIVIHAFSSRDTGADEYARFGHALGAPDAAPGRLTAAASIGDVSLAVGWARGAAEYLEPHEEPLTLGAFPAIANADLTPSAIPMTASDPGWKRFALTFDGDRRFAEACGDIANHVRRQFRHEHGFPDGLDLDELRACLFYEQRRYNHFGRGPEGDDAEYVGALLAEIRRRVAR